MTNPILMGKLMALPSSEDRFLLVPPEGLGEAEFVDKLPSASELKGRTYLIDTTPWKEHRVVRESAARFDKEGVPNRSWTRVGRKQIPRRVKMIMVLMGVT